MEFPADWVQQVGVNLNSVYPPELGARFRVHERLRPQPRLSEIVELVLASDPDFRVRDIGELTRIVTVEGEYGAFVEIAGWRQGTEARRFVGAVFLDEFATALDCVAILPPHFGTVRQHALDILRASTFELARRPRRFFYVPPVSWQAVPSGAIASWYPLDFPNNRSNIVVPPARFLDGDPQPAIERAFAELGLGLAVGDSSRERITSAGGHEGTYLRVHGTRAGHPETIFRELAIFAVAPYVYRMRLECGTADRVSEVREVLRGVAGSFKPLPGAEESRVGRAFASSSASFDHWAS